MILSYHAGRKNATIARCAAIWYAERMEKTDAIKKLLSGYALTPNRALGQNFLADEAALTAIAAAATSENLPVLEIGPGLGALTRALCLRAPQVVAIEKDAKLAAILPQLVPEENLTVITGDALKEDILSAMGHAPFAVAGNLPYYITTPISERLICLRPESLTFLVQKEAAARYFAGPKEEVYGPLAVLSQVFYAPEKLMDVPRASFYPVPNVDSLAVRLAPKKDAPQGGAAPFFHFLNRAFAMRRKTFQNNFRGEAGVLDALSELHLADNVRAEALEPEALFALYRLLCSAK